MTNDYLFGYLIGAILSVVIMYQIIKYAVKAGVLDALDSRKTALYAKAVNNKKLLETGKITQEEHDKKLAKLNNSILNRW